MHHAQRMVFFQIQERGACKLGCFALLDHRNLPYVFEKVESPLSPWARKTRCRTNMIQGPEPPPSTLDGRCLSVYKGWTQDLSWLPQIILGDGGNSLFQGPSLSLHQGWIGGKFDTPLPRICVQPNIGLWRDIVYISMFPWNQTRLQRMPLIRIYNYLIYN